MVRLVSIALSLVGLFLSSWIVLIAPTFFWLTLSVGAPEISPWLIVFNSVALILAIALRSQAWSYLWISLSVIALVLSCIPLSQLPQTVQQANQTMENFYTPAELQALPEPKLGRSRPYQLKDSFLGISVPLVRHITELTFTSQDGTSLPLELYLPTQAGRYPGIVTIYGGAWQRGEPGDNADFNRYLAARGYAVWAIAYRHAPAYQFPTQYEDVQAAIAYIQTHATTYETNPNQLVLMGRSAGSQLAMLAAYRQANPAVRGVIGIYGPVNLTEGYNNPPQPDPIQSRPVLEAYLGGPPQQFPQRYRDASPITYITKPQPPTLLIYGGRDHIVQAQYGQHLFERLQQTGSQAGLIKIPWADHVFDAVFNGPSSQLSLYYMERFLAWVFSHANAGG